MAGPQEDTSQPFGLCDLPARLRIRIYLYLFDLLPMARFEDHTTREPAALLKSCKQIFTEAKAEFDRYLISRRLGVGTELTMVNNNLVAYVHSVARRLEERPPRETYVDICMGFYDKLPGAEAALDLIEGLKKRCDQRSVKTFSPGQHSSN